MAPSCSSGLALWFCILFSLSLKPLEARGLAGKPPQKPASEGICASSVRIFGYKCEEHDVVTQDGYILNMQRIPEGRTGAGKGSRRQPVLIQHGVLVDGMSWLFNPADQNLPLILADQGFDVWMGNTRGTRYSRRHNKLNPTQPAFWDWTWDELVSFDLPAMFNHIQGQTGGQKIHYLGHSLGTLIGFASFSEKGLVDKVKSAAMLSPIAYLSHMTTVIGNLAARIFLAEATAILGLAEFNPKSGPVGTLIKAICHKPGVDCYDLLAAITGKNCCLNATSIELFLANEPQSTSTKNMIHLAQTVRDNVLRKYNYGIAGNMRHYGQALPPSYNISAIPHDLPLFFSYGGLDHLADVKDVEFLIDQFKFHHIDKMNVQFVKEYAHADFIMGVNAKDIVYNQVVTFYKRHT